MLTWYCSRSLAPTAMSSYCRAPVVRFSICRSSARGMYLTRAVPLSVVRSGISIPSVCSSVATWPNATGTVTAVVVWYPSCGFSAWMVIEGIWFQRRASLSMSAPSFGSFDVMTLSPIPSKNSSSVSFGVVGGSTAIMCTSSAAAPATVPIAFVVSATRRASSCAVSSSARPRLRASSAARCAFARSAHARFFSEWGSRPMSRPAMASAPYRSSSYRSSSYSSSSCRARRSADLERLPPLTSAPMYPYPPPSGGLPALGGDRHRSPPCPGAPAYWSRSSSLYGPERARAHVIRRSGGNDTPSHRMRAAAGGLSPTATTAIAIASARITRDAAVHTSCRALARGGLPLPTPARMPSRALPGAPAQPSHPPPAAGTRAPRDCAFVGSLIFTCVCCWPASSLVSALAVPVVQNRAARALLSVFRSCPVSAAAFSVIRCAGASVVRSRPGWAPPMLSMADATFLLTDATSVGQMSFY